MNTRSTNVCAFLLVCAAFAAGVFVYPSLPTTIAGHWNAAGEANGTLPRFWGVFLLPMIMGAIYLLFVGLPFLKELQKDLPPFRKTYNRFFLALMLFFLYIHSLTLWWNMGHSFDFSRALAPALGFLWIMLGSTMGTVKRNSFIGIRTPWTLRSDEVWNKTHAIAKTLFQLSGVIALVGTFVPRYSFFFSIIPVLLTSLVVTIYSYRISNP